MTVDQYKVWYFKRHKKTESQFFSTMNKFVREKLRGIEASLTEPNYQNLVSLAITQPEVKELMIDLYFKIGRDYGKVLTEGIISGNNQIKVNGFFGSWSEFWLDFVAEYFETQYSNRIVTIRESLIRGVVQTISRELLGGGAVREIAKDLSDNFGRKTGLYRWQMRRIARTETGVVMNLAAFESYKNLGLLVNKVWVSALDERTRDGEADGEFNHLIMHGQEIKLGEKFSVPRNNGQPELLSYPQDPNGSASNVINCRCTIAPRLVYDEFGLPIEYNYFTGQRL